MTDAFRKFDLKGRTALVTGGGTGIGYYMTRGLMRSGARVMIAARRADVLEQAAVKLRSESQAGSVCAHTVDLSRRDSIKALAEHTIRTLDGVDIFIGNAAQDVFEPVEKISDSVIDQITGTSLAVDGGLGIMLRPHSTPADPVYPPPF